MRHWILSLLLVSGMALADETPLIEVGAGLKSDSRFDGVEFLIRVKHRGLYEITNASFYGYVARISAEVGVDTEGYADERIPTFKVHFTPIGVGSQPEENNEGEFRALSTVVTRDTKLDRDAAVSISVIGTRLSRSLDITDDLSFIALITADALGYKYANYTSSDRSDFSGARFGSGAAEAGLHARLSEKFTVTAVIGGEFEAAFGKQSRVNLDSAVYAAVRVKVTQFLQIVAEGRANNFRDLGDEDFVDRGESVMMGVMFLF